MPRADVVSVIEALYALDLPKRIWLGQIAQASIAGIPASNVGAYALTYDASDIHDCRFPAFAATSTVDPELARVLEFDFPALWHRSPEMVDAVFRHIAHGPSRDLPLTGELALTHEQFAGYGVHQVLGVNGVNVDGRGAHFGLLLRRRTKTVDPDILTRLATHLAAAARLRLRLGDAPPIQRADAVLDANSGRLAHATRGAQLREAREALRTAARRLDTLRGPVRRRDPDKAARLWRALVRGRWSLVDHFDTDGRRYVLAQSNESPVAPLALLSERELQAVGLAAIGHANKMIGYELGIAVSTVGVLLGRAARKLGTRTRRELVAAYEAASARPRRRIP